MDLKKKDFTTIVSRAFKPMKEFFEIITASGLSYKKILLMKGENFMNDFSEAKKYFEINCEYHDSVTNQASKIFVIKSVSKI
jgi:16S rRNA (guanine527-N7)-methyltransferase